MTAPTPHAALVDAVARAMAFDADARDNWDEYSEAWKTAWRSSARAAIAAVREALREPDAAMVLFGFNALRTDNVIDSSEQGRIRRIYRAMLAASPLAEDGDA